MAAFKLRLRHYNKWIRLVNAHISSAWTNLSCKKSYLMPQFQNNALVMHVILSSQQMNKIHPNSLSLGLSIGRRDTTCLLHSSPPLLGYTARLCSQPPLQSGVDIWLHSGQSNVGSRDCPTSKPMPSPCSLPHQLHAEVSEIHRRPETYSERSICLWATISFGLYVREK